MRHEFVLWDWKEQPNWDEIQRLQGRGLRRITPVADTGTDDYVVVLTARRITPERAQQLWDAHLHEEI